MDKRNIYILATVAVAFLILIILKNKDLQHVIITDDITLSIWASENEESNRTIDEITAAFQERYPTVNVIRSHYAPEDLRVQFQTAALARGGGDIVIAANDLAGPFSIMETIHSLQDKIDFSPYSDYVVNAVRDHNGNIWGLPIASGNHLMLLANRSLINNAPLETIEQLVDLAKSLTDQRARRFGFAYNLAEPFWFAPFVPAFGGDLLQGGRPSLDTPEMRAALQLVRDFKFSDQITPRDCDYNCMDALFVEGRTAIIINGDWAIQKYEELLGDNLLILPLPKLDRTSLHMRPFVSGKYIFLNRRLEGQRLEAAKQLALKLASDESQKIYVERNRRLPSLKRGRAVDAVNQDPILSAMYKALEHGQPNPMAIEMRAVWDAMRPQLQAVMAGRATPERAAAVMQNDAETRIRSIRE